MATRAVGSRPCSASAAMRPTSSGAASLVGQLDVAAAGAERRVEPRIAERVDGSSGSAVAGAPSTTRLRASAVRRRSHRAPVA